MASSRLVDHSSDQSLDPLLSSSSFEIVDSCSQIIHEDTPAIPEKVNIMSIAEINDNSRTDKGPRSSIQDSAENSRKPRISFQESGVNFQDSRRSSQDSRHDTPISINSSQESKILSRMSYRMSRRNSQGSRRNSQVLQSRLNLTDSRKNSVDLIGSSPALSSCSSLSIDRVWRIGGMADYIKEETTDISPEYQVQSSERLRHP